MSYLRVVLITAVMVFGVTHECCTCIYHSFVCVGLVDSEAVFGDEHLSTLFTDEPWLPLVHCIHMTNQPLSGFITFLTERTLFVFGELTKFNMSLKYPVVVKFLLAL